jgi:hypothetical protein
VLGILGALERGQSQLRVNRILGLDPQDLDGLDCVLVPFALFGTPPSSPSAC